MMETIKAGINMIDKAITKSFPTTKKGKGKKKKQLFKMPEFTNSLNSTKPEQDEQEAEAKAELKTDYQVKPVQKPANEAKPLAIQPARPMQPQPEYIIPRRAVMGRRMSRITPARRRIGR